MIELVTGGLGSGKTFRAVMIIVDALLEGKVVVTNVKLSMAGSEC